MTSNGNAQREISMDNIQLQVQFRPIQAFFLSFLEQKGQKPFFVFSFLLDSLSFSLCISLLPGLH